MSIGPYVPSPVTSCFGKHPHPSRGAAVRESRGRGGIEPYRCRWCGNWHVGHHPKRMKNPSQERERMRREEIEADVYG